MELRGHQRLGLWPQERLICFPSLVNLCTAATEDLDIGGQDHRVG